MDFQGFSENREVNIMIFTENETIGGYQKYIRKGIRAEICLFRKHIEKSRMT